MCRIESLIVKMYSEKVTNYLFKGCSQQNNPTITMIKQFYLITFLLLLLDYLITKHIQRLEKRKINRISFFFILIMSVYSLRMCTSIFSLIRPEFEIWRYCCVCTCTGLQTRMSSLLWIVIIFIMTFFTECICNPIFFLYPNYVIPLKVFNYLPSFVICIKL